MYGTVRTVVWEDGGGNPASYPIQPGSGHGRVVSASDMTFASLWTNSHMCFS